jgi:hypothetical protein
MTQTENGYGRRGAPGCCQVSKDRLGATLLTFNPDEVYLEGEQGAVLGSLVEGAVTVARPGAAIYLPLVVQ